MFYERIFLAFAVLIAISFFLAGCFMAIWSGKSEWVNRSGACIVASEIIVVMVEQKRRSRFEKISPKIKHANKYISREIERAEKSLFYVGACLIVFGEFIHGFGDIAFDWIMRK